MQSSRMLLLGVLAASALSLVGCGIVPGPQVLNNGKTYWIDDDCALQRPSDGKVIKCYTEDGHYTGTREPMSREDMENYYQQQQLEMQQEELRLREEELSNQRELIRSLNSKKDK